MLGAITDKVTAPPIIIPSSRATKIKPMAPDKATERPAFFGSIVKAVILVKCIVFPFVEWTPC